MIGALIGIVCAVVLNIVAVAFFAGRLSQTVKDLPRAMRLEMKLEIQAALERHLATYRHEEREVTSPGCRPAAPAQEVAP
jgi:hypothetical protein